MEAGELVKLSEKAVDAADPGTTLRAAAELRRKLEDLEVDSVERAVEQGWSWAEIAASLGISKQAAHKRYAKRLPPRQRLVGRWKGLRPLTPPDDAHIVVTAQARRAVKAAQIAALALGHDEVVDAHLILGLLADTDGAAGRALSEIGIEFERARDQIAALDLPRGRFKGPELNASVAGRVPISAPAQTALKQSLREATRLGHRHLGVEHLLLALLRDEKSSAVATLASLGVSADDLERCLGKVLKEAPFVSSA